MAKIGHMLMQELHICTLQDRKIMVLTCVQTKKWYGSSWSFVPRSENTKKVQVPQDANDRQNGSENVPYHFFADLGG